MSSQPLHVSKKNAVYRRAKFFPPVDQSLQEFVAAALVACPTIGKRTEAVNAAATEKRVISHHSVSPAFVCGTLVHFEAGAPQMVIVDDPSQLICALASLSPKKVKGKFQEFVPGALFFAISGNHVALVQSHPVRAKAFEDYLAWLLRSKTGLVSGEQGLVLADEPLKATADRIRKSHVNAVSIGRPMMQPLPDQVAVTRVVPGTDRKVTQTTTKVSPKPGMVKLLRDYFTGDAFAEINLDDAVFDGNLEVWLEIRYPKHSRRRPHDTVKLLDDLGVALRDQDDGTVELRLADNSVVKGSDLKISTQVDFRSSSGVPHVQVLYDELKAWLKSLVDNKVVPS